MAALAWDNVGERFYETGIDRGVFYKSDMTGVAWNGLVSVAVTSNVDVQPVYFDGVKVYDLAKLSDFAGAITAYTYPEIFDQYQGYDKLGGGVFIGDQSLKTFCLSYRTKVGNDLDPDVGYKINILYDLTAKPASPTYKTLTGGAAEGVQFQWDITSVPSNASGFRPSAHLVIDTRTLDPTLLADLEEMLYGSSTQNAKLLPLSEIQQVLAAFYLIKIVNVGDGTWTATTHEDHPEWITVDGDGLFTITNANSMHSSDGVSYVISDTLDESDIT